MRRWLHLQNSVICDGASSFFCRFAASPCRLFSGLHPSHIRTYMIIIQYA